MNIETVRDNLRKTIAGKEAYLARENENRKSEDAHVRMVAFTVVKMLEINIDELKRILQDVEQCIDEVDTLKEDLNAANGRVRQLERRASANSWEGAVDRQSGAFDESELRGRDGWS